MANNGCYAGAPNTSEQHVLDVAGASDQPCGTYTVCCPSGNTGTITVRIPKLHGTTVGVGATLIAGAIVPFHVGANGIQDVYISASDGTSQAYGFPNSR